ncbi:hypothetical protein PDM99_25675 [Bacillus cereus group sp. Bc200]|nr:MULTISPECIES: hypothetical protein [unclassified Bacillus cereus group]MDA2263604.1 hypothetical protein [Bacillus cereus group sp. Bc200]
MYATIILNLTQIPFVPETVKNMKVMAVFLSPNFAKDLSNLSGNFCIREYGSLEELVPNEMSLTFPNLKPFPLIARLLFGNIEKQTKQHFKKFIFSFWGNSKFFS